MTACPHPRSQTYWVVSDGKVGMESQCIGLAEAMGANPIVKRIQVRRPWRWLPPLWVPDPLASLGPKKDRLAPPWPDVLIASGRQSVAVSIAIRALSAGSTFTVQIQNPAVDPALFDAIVAPGHDRLSGPNIIATLGGMNRVTAARLAQAADRFAPRWSDLPRPLVAVMLGGSNKVYRMPARIGQKLGQDLAVLARREGAGLLVTPSRRTAPKVLEEIRRALDGLPAWIWDGSGENPYMGYLALADAIVVTADSVNMVSEAAATGKPVFVVELKGGSRKFRAFHEDLRGKGITRPFEGRLNSWHYTALHETERAAEEIRRRFGARLGLGTPSLN
jgi:uncharacterized protein